MMYLSQFRTKPFLKVLPVLFLILFMLLSSSLLFGDDDIEVEGPIQAIGQDSLVVNSMVFRVDANTEIKDEYGNILTLSDLNVGDFVEVEAMLQPDSTFGDIQQPCLNHPSRYGW